MLLVLEHPKRQPGVQVRVVALGALERRVLVVLDQMVIRVRRERQRVQPQSVHHRHPQQPQPGSGGLQMGKVELDDVVTHHKVSTPSQPVKRNKRLTNRAPIFGRCDIVTVQACDAPAGLALRTGHVRPLDALVRVGARSCQSVDAAVMPRDFKVDRQAARQHSVGSAHDLKMPGRRVPQPTKPRLQVCAITAEITLLR